MTFRLSSGAGAMLILWRYRFEFRPTDTDNKFRIIAVIYQCRYHVLYYQK